ncbi:amidohydrolase family protein [Actinomadura rugatobispora]|uniref:Amidohydrolase family protein n=1 Tax=Actinomadura rugatobispora TaxID=1994 RepID=A0ABW0ZXR2_9ACTN
MSLVIDAQVHIWGPSTPERPWPPGHGEPQRAEPLSGDELLSDMDRCGVHRAVLVPPSWQGDGNDFALEAARAHPDRFAVMGRFDALSAPRPEALETWCDDPAMLGVRLTLHTEDGIRALARRELDWFWRAAQEHAVPVMIYAPGNLAAVDDLARRFPRLVLTVCHAGLPLEDLGDRVWAELEHLWPLAEHDNVAVKAASLPYYVREPWPFAELQGVVRRMVDVFGPRRVFWGSDLSRLPCAYDDLVRFFRDLDFLSADERDQVLGRGIAEWLRWTTDD